MKFLFLLSVFLMYSSSSMALPALPMLPPETPTVTTPPPATTAPAQTAPSSTITSGAAQTMDANLENDMLNRIASLLYSPVDARVQALTQLQNQARNSYISPTVQYSYYTAIYRIYSDLLGTSKVQNIATIRRFVDLLKKVISSPIMDANQKSQASAMTPQLMQKISDLSKPVSKTAPKASDAKQRRGTRVR